MPSPYDLLILDYGGVYSFGYNLASFDEVMTDVFGKKPVQRTREDIASLSRTLAANAISAGTYVARVAQLLGVPVPSLSDFENATMFHGLPPSSVMIDLVKEARQDGIKVSLLSDVYDFELKTKRPEGRYEGFDYASFSCEIGHTKADIEAFEHMLHHFDVQPEKALYVDDVSQFVHNAESIGIKSLWADKSRFRNAEELAQAIRELLYA